MLICTTNAIESLNARFGRSAKARDRFPAEQAALKRLYLAVISLDPTGRGRHRWSNRWGTAERRRRPPQLGTQVNKRDRSYTFRLALSQFRWCLDVTV